VRKFIIPLLVLLGLVLIVILFLYLIRSPLIYRSGAYTLTSSTTTGVTTSSSTLSLDNSYVFASPLRAKVGGESIRITVYILDNRGLGISGKKVSIGNGGGTLTVSPVQPATDAQGKAIFDVYSASSPGVYIIQASADGVALTQKATITFD